MEQEELEEQTACASCRRPFWAGAEPSYSFSSNGALCLNCAIARGGSYDAYDDRWLKAPDVSDLVEPDTEERPRGMTRH